MVLILRLFLIVVVIVGSVVMAPSRGQMAGLSQIEICSDVGTQTLIVDARGKPVGPHHLCPNCLACVATGPLPDMAAVRFSISALPLNYPLPHPVAAARIIAIHPTARDPPMSA